mmetsp:Transcript_23177/g.55024  ORF Transcript_23177/g.55024 Transcript_23177/m.55024 type:complete len:251 (-) Transcript_23177:206-958(-)
MRADPLSCMCRPDTLRTRPCPVVGTQRCTRTRPRWCCLLAKTSCLDTAHTLRARARPCTVQAGTADTALAVRGSPCCRHSLRAPSSAAQTLCSAGMLAPCCLQDSRNRRGTRRRKHWQTWMGWRARSQAGSCSLSRARFQTTRCSRSRGTPHTSCCPAPTCTSRVCTARKRRGLACAHRHNTVQRRPQQCLAAPPRSRARSSFRPAPRTLSPRLRSRWQRPSSLTSQGLIAGAACWSRSRIGSGQQERRG